MKKRKVWFGIFAVILLIGLFLISGIMTGDKSLLGAGKAFLDYYEIYLYVLGIIGITFYYFDGISGQDHMEKTLREMAVILLGVFLTDAIKLGMYQLMGFRYWLIPIKLLLSTLITVVLCRLIGRKGVFRQAGKLLYTYRFGLAFMAIYMIQMISQMGKELNAWSSVWYIMDYRDGVASRILPGQILSLLTGGNHKSTGIVYVFILAGLGIVILLTCILLDRYINMSRGRERKAAILLSLLFVASPTGIRYLWNEESMGRIETYLLVFLLLAVLCFQRIKNPVLRYAILSVFSVVCMACYHAYLFLYFPVVFTMVVCDIAGEKKGRRVKLVGGIFMCIITALAFLYFQFMGTVNYTTAGEMAQVLRGRTNMEILEETLICEFFEDVVYAWKAFFEGNILNTTNWYMRELGFLIILLLLPLILLFIMAWKHFLRNSEERIFWKDPYFWILLCDCLIIIQFVLTMDWGRWFAAAVSVHFFQIMYIHAKGFPEGKSFMEKLGAWAEKHRILCAVVLIYMATLTSMVGATQMKTASRLLNIIFGNV